jgi:hypothetical protein
MAADEQLHAAHDTETAHTILRHMEFHHTELFFLLFIHVETHRCLRFRLAGRNGKAMIVHLLAFASVGSE